MKPMLNALLEGLASEIDCFNCIGDLVLRKRSPANQSTVSSIFAEAREFGMSWGEKLLEKLLFNVSWTGETGIRIWLKT